MKAKIEKMMLDHPYILIVSTAIIAIAIGLLMRPLFSSLASSSELSEPVVADVVIDPVESATEVVQVTPEPTPEPTPVPMKTVIRYDVPLSESDQEFVRKVASHYNFDERLIYQIMEAESSFNPNNVSSTNDHGIMQVNKQWYKEYLDIDDGFNYVFDDGINLYNIRQNVVIGIRELDYWRKQCLSKGYESTQSILECYNRGFGYFKNTSYTRYSDNVFSKDIPEYEIEVPVE